MTAYSKGCEDRGGGRATCRDYRYDEREWNPFGKQLCKGRVNVEAGYDLVKRIKGMAANI